MKISQIFVFLFLCVIFTNCSKDQTPVPKPDTEEQPDSMEPKTEVYFTLNTFVPPHEVEESDDWIILHDSNGKLLDYKSYEAGDKFEFEGPSDALTPTISVSYFNYRTNNGKYHTIRTTTNVEKGFVQNFGPYTPSENEDLVKIGEFDFTINNIPDPDRDAYPIKVELSSGKGRLGGVSSGIGDLFGTQKLELNSIDAYEGFDDYLVTILDDFNTLKYYFFNNSAAQPVSKDYAIDFIEFEKDISISLPDYNSYSLNIAGFKDEQEFESYRGYWLHDVISVLNTDVITNPLKIGYIDVFNKYRTRFNISMEDYNYSIVKYGTPLNAIVIPEKPTVTITDTSLQTFKFNVDIEFESASHSWFSEQGSTNTNDLSRTGWSIIAPYEYNLIIGDLPLEILEKYPDINPDSLEYSSSSFNLPLEGAEYLSSHTITVYKN